MKKISLELMLCDSRFPCLCFGYVFSENSISEVDFSVIDIII